jgi:hypothetical protein
LPGVVQSFAQLALDGFRGMAVPRFEQVVGIEEVKINVLVLSPGFH